MRAIHLLTPLSAALLLAACGDGSSGTIFGEDGERVDYAIDDAGDGSDIVTSKITGPEGQVVERQEGSDVPVQLPDGFSVYPDAKIVNNSVTKMGSASGTTLILESEASPSEIAAFYKDQAEKAGMEIKIDVEMDTSHAVAADRDSDNTKLTASARRDEGAETTTVMLSLVSEPEG